MSDGDNDTSAQKIAELEAKLTESDAELTKQKEITANAEKKFGEWGNEQGELRKENKQILEELEKLKTAKPDATPPVPPKKEEDKPKTADEIEAQLGDGQRKLVEGVFEQLDPAEKIKFSEDDEYRKGILQEALLQLKEVPDSPWKKPTDKKESAKETNSRLAKMFEIAKQKGGFQPEAPTAGKNSATGRGGSAIRKGNSQDDVSSATSSGILGPHGS